MISDSIIKNQFIIQTANWGFDKLKKEQISILNEKLGILSAKHFDVRELIQDVTTRRMNISTSSGGVTFKFQVLNKLRFSDMRKLGNAKVYNKPMWGIIFGEKDSVLTRIEYDFTESTRDEIYSQLKSSLDNQNIEL